MSSKAPICLFVYNRVNHTQKTLDYLQRAQGITDTDIHVFCDGPKNETETNKVAKVRETVSKINFCKELFIYESETNKGLADAIVYGVSLIAKKYGKVIVLEDDILVSETFLIFMNEALDLYVDNKTVWHISGWNYPIQKEISDKSFFWEFMNCWGWATWFDRWELLELDRNKIFERHSQDKKFLKAFSINFKTDFWSQIELNYTGQKKSWAIFWLYTIFINKGLCLNPVNTLVLNNGFDGTGENCSDEDPFHGQKLNHNQIKLPKKSKVNRIRTLQIARFYSPNDNSTKFFFFSIRYILGKLF